MTHSYVSGLIDGVLYTDQVLTMAGVSSAASTSTTQPAALQQQAITPNILNMRAYIKATQDKKDESSIADGLSGRAKLEPKIALVFACGNIMRGPGDANSTDPQAASDTVAAAMRAAYTDPSVKGIVVRVDSRGGSAVASDSIRRELEKARSLGLPVVVSMGAYAASGGYYIATGADRIVAQPGTITGSIGAFFGKLNMQKLFSNLGVDVDEIAIGKDANFMNPALPLSASQRTKAEKTGRQVSLSLSLSLSLSVWLSLPPARVWPFCGTTAGRAHTRTHACSHEYL